MRHLYAMKVGDATRTALRGLRDRSPVQVRAHATVCRALTALAVVAVWSLLPGAALASGPATDTGSVRRMTVGRLLRHRRPDRDDGHHRIEPGI